MSADSKKLNILKFDHRMSADSKKIKYIKI